MKSLLTSALLSLLVVAPASAGTNLLANPNFDEAGGSYNGWTTFGNGPNISTAANDNIFLSGVAAAKIFGEGNGCPFEVFDVGGFFQSFIPNVGEEYTFTGSSFIAAIDPMIGTSPCENNRAVAKVVFFDAANGGNELLAHEVLIGEGNMPTETWMDFSVSAIAPPGALRVEALILFLQPGCDVGATFVDDLSLCADAPAAAGPNLLANPSFDGDLTGWQVFGNVFHDVRSFSMRTFGGAAKMFSTFTPDSPSGLFQNFTASEGDGFRLSSWALNTCQEDGVFGSNDNYTVARIVFRDGQGTEVGSNEAVLNDASIGQFGTWQQNEVTAIAPVGTESVDAFLLFISPTEQGGAFWYDDAEFVQIAGTPAPELSNTNLAQNFPNPFNPSTRIDFVVGQAGPVRLAIYDLQGRHIVDLVNGTQSEGAASVIWDGRGSDGATVASGSYRYVLETPAGRISRQLVLLK